MIIMYMSRSLLNFSDVVFKMDVWRTYLFFFISGVEFEFGFQSLTKVYVGILISVYLCM